MRALIALLITLHAGPAWGQRFVPSAIESDVARARAVLDRAAAAHRASLLDSVVVAIAWQGTHAAVLQNVEPDFTRHPLPRQVSLTLDQRRQRVAFEEHLTRAGVYAGWHRYLVREGSGTDINLNALQYRSTQPRAIVRRAREMFPTMLLSEARRATFLTSLPPDRSDRDAVLVVLPDGARHALYFDRATGLLAELETPVTLPILGARAWEVEFLDYRTVSGMPFPMRRSVRLSGAFAESLSVACARVAQAAADSIFALPPRAVALDAGAIRQAAGTHIEALLPGVLRISGIGGGDATALAVAIDSGTLVLGAPMGISDSVRAVIAERFAGKPIRYVVPTHHHFDHAGGLPAYLEHGARVVTTPGNLAWARELAARHAPAGERAIELIEGGTRTFGSGATRVMLFDIGPTPHAREMVVAYLPALGLVYQGDLLELDDDEPITPRTANEVTASLLRAIEQLRLDVETIVGTEGRAATLADLRRAVTLRDEARRVRGTSATAPRLGCPIG